MASGMIAFRCGMLCCDEGQVGASMMREVRIRGRRQGRRRRGGEGSDRKCLFGSEDDAKRFAKNGMTGPTLCQ